MNCGRLLRTVLLVAVLAVCIFCRAGAQEYQGLPYRNPALPIDARVDDLVGRMTLEEKISQTLNNAPAIERLGIPAYEWWNEALHGVARAGVATVFPQAIGLAAMWDEDQLFSVATVISDEARAKHHEFVRQGQRGRYQGLTFWSPNINIFRDPRWGRGMETYGEDPYLTGRLGIAFIRGLQGDDPKYIKVIATSKHYAVHSGPEPKRHVFDAQASDRDLYETYLPQFRATVTEGKVYSIMGAYNRFRGESASAHQLLLQELLRNKWGFQGYVVSDCGAIRDIYANHKIVKTAEEASALALKRGCDLDCGNEYKALAGAVRQGILTEKELDVSVKRLFTARMKLGMFDPPEMVKWARIPYSVNDSPGNARLSEEAARKSIVLLKNSGGMLPLRRNLRTIAVIGPNADDAEVLLGNYNGTPSHSVTPLAGIRAKAGSTAKVLYARGCDIAEGMDLKPQRSLQGRDYTGEAIAAAKQADVAILFLGLSPRLEGEEMRVQVPGFSGGDRLTIDLPKVQEDLMRAVAATGTPTVLVLLNGSALAVNWADENIPAIVEAWYPGQAAGTAIADILFGDYNPGGRLPVTFYKSLDQLPPFEDYSMKERTYKYFSGKPLYPFGHGLSYTTFAYRNLRIPKSVKAGDPIEVSVTAKNTGHRSGDEVIQLYSSNRQASAPVPIRKLVGFRRITLKAGESRHVTFTIDPRELSLITDDTRRVIEPGVFDLSVGGKQPGFTGTADSNTTKVLTGQFTVIGNAVELDR